MNVADWSDPDDPLTHPSNPFIDRVPESEALSRALVEHRARMDADTLSARELRNVLTFYGSGGVGKSELSARLASWLRGDQKSIVAEDWGPPPDFPIDAIVRWDVNDSHGALDVVELLAQLRSQLGTVQEGWPAFDLAFADFFQVMRPGTDLSLRTPGAAQTTLSEVIAGLFGDAVSATGLALSGGVGAGAFGIVRRLLSGAISAGRARRVMTAFPQVARIVDACEDLPGPPDRVAAVAAQIVFLLSEEIHRRPPGERPLVVVFVDHMERLQVTGENYAGESALNRLVSRLPYFLFVISGRNSLRWHDPDATHLSVRGREKWPLLGTDVMPLDEPHQHFLGNLSPRDAERFLEIALRRMQAKVSPGLIPELARLTDGWPLHLDTLIVVAEERVRAGIALSASDLARPLPSLVDRLLEDLPQDEEQAFRGACLLPYFDAELAAAAGGVSLGAVERLLRRTIVRDNPGSPYPYRIHDTLRSLVRTSGSRADGGWADEDWTVAAQRAVDEARRRFDAAMASGSDSAAISSLALAINVAVENGATGPWLVPAIRISPSIRELSALVPTENSARATPQLRDILEFIRLRARSDEDVTEALKELVSHRTDIASTAALWRVYDLRARGRIDEALRQLTELEVEFADRPELYRNQRATLRLARRFRDAMAVEGLTSSQQSRLEASIFRSHGVLAGSSDGIREFANRTKGRRLQMELLGDWLVVRHRECGVAREVAEELYEQADAIGHNVAKAQIASVLGQMQVFDDRAFAAHEKELQELSNRRGRPYIGWTMLLAVRAFACGEEAQARKAQDIAGTQSYRSSAYIPAEILLEHLGFTLPDRQTQWLEPRDVVRERWMKIFSSMVERARHI